jgi:dephospho-CoA kinase
MKRNEDICRLGITGGIGSGKTIVSKFLERFGMTVFNLDEVAKTIMRSDAQVKFEIIQSFGEQSYHKGLPNTDYLAKMAFKEGRVEQLNHIVHPRVYEKIADEEATLVSKGIHIVAIESALMLKNGRPNHFSVIALIEAKKHIRKERIKARNNMPDSDLEARFNVQETFFNKDFLVPQRDVILTNDTTLKELETKVEGLVKHVKNVCDSLLRSLG